jgi:hypothetical protein
MSISPEKISEIDTEVRKLVYDHFMTHSASVSRAEVAAHLSLPEAVAEASYKRLAEAHVLVLQPASGQVLMASPFSAVPTAFRVVSGTKHWWGNCIWDGLRILAMTAQDGTLQTSCPDCGEALSLTVAAANLAHAEGVVHFAVPAAHWWDDIVFT